MIQTYMYTPAFCSERMQLAKWTENVKVHLFSFSLLNKRQIAFTIGCRTFLFTVIWREWSIQSSRSRERMLPPSAIIKLTISCTAKFEKKSFTSTLLLCHLHLVCPCTWCVLIYKHCLVALPVLSCRGANVLTTKIKQNKFTQRLINLL